MAPQNSRSEKKSKLLAGLKSRTTTPPDTSLLVPPTLDELAVMLGKTQKGEIDDVLERLPILIKYHRYLSQILRNVAAVPHEDDSSAKKSVVTGRVLDELIQSTVSDVVALQKVKTERLQPIAADMDVFPVLASGHTSGIYRVKKRIADIGIGNDVPGGDRISRTKRDDLGRLAAEINEELEAKLPSLPAGTDPFYEAMNKILPRMFEQDPELEQRLGGSIASTKGKKPSQVRARLRSEIKGRLKSLRGENKG